MKLLNLLSKNIILEVSDKIKKQLLAKFKPTTEDSDETILNNIDMFDRYKQGLPVEKRDIILGENLEFVRYHATKLKLNIITRNSEALAIEKFLKSRISKKIPLEVFETNKILMKTVDFTLGQDCKNCNCGKQKMDSFHGQYYCYWCNEFFCEACGDKYDISKKGLDKFIHPHKLVYLINSPANEVNPFMRDIDLFKLGNPNIIEDYRNEKIINDIFFIDKNICKYCKYCGGTIDGNPEYICLNCNPGYSKESLVNLCHNCFDSFRGKKINNGLSANHRENEIRSCHDISKHIYIKIIK